MDIERKANERLRIEVSQDEAEILAGVLTAFVAENAGAGRYRAHALEQLRVMRDVYNEQHRKWPRLLERERQGLREGTLRWCNEEGGCDWTMPAGGTCPNCEQYHEAMERHDVLDEIEERSQAGGQG